MNRARSLLLGLMLVLTGIAVHAERPPVEEGPIHFDIEAQRLTTALNAWARQSKLQILTLLGETTDRLQAPAIKGTLTPRAALKKLLAGTTLVFEFSDKRTVAVYEGAPPKERPKPRRRSSAPLGTRSTPEPPPDQSRALQASFIDEITVTGSHLRDVNVAAPKIVIDRKQIEWSGFATMQQLLRALPQNFGGGVTEYSGVGFVAGPDGSFTQGTGVNLRGLGNGATLVLLNGQRLAPASFGEFVDISGIPLSAIERIEILTDGASAIYGSDAVAGVVNIMLRDDYDGAETSARYGSVTDGSSDEVQLAQTFGTRWDSGRMLATYEYYSRDELRAEDRSYTREAAHPQTLLGDQSRHNAIVTGTQVVSDRVKMVGSAHYARRVYDGMGRMPGEPVQHETGRVVQAGGVLGVTADIRGGWRAKVEASGSRSTADSQATILDLHRDLQTRFVTSVLELQFDGPGWQLPGGAVRVAAGGGLRHERYQEKPLVSQVFKDDRNVLSAYAELLVPLFGAANARRGIRSLDLSIAGRYEEYDDFGSTAKPKVGLAWRPHERLRLRSTFSESFRAPTHEQLRTDAAIGLFPLPDLAPRFATPTIFFQGGNAQLEPETSRNWTVGADYSDPSDDLRVALTFFDIKYSNRIEFPPGLFDALLNEALVGEFLIRDPDPALVEAIALDPNFVNFLDLPLASVGAVLDLRLHNSARNRLQGADLDLSYGMALPLGDLTLQMNLQYLHDSEQQVVATAPVVDIINTVFNPLRIKTRASAVWELERVSTIATLNYMGAYRDNRTTPRRDVGAWITLDAGFRYELDGILPSTLFRDTVLSLNVINVFDRDPPFVLDTFNHVNFDGANASALGRFVALRVVTQW